VKKGFLCEIAVLIIVAGGKMADILLFADHLKSPTLIRL